MNRRAFLHTVGLGGAFIAAPAIVHAVNLMPYVRATRWRLDASVLELPEGVYNAWKDAEIREVMGYYINTDSFIVRWDTMINGRQFHTAIDLCGPWNGIATGHEALNVVEGRHLQISGKRFASVRDFDAQRSMYRAQARQRLRECAAGMPL